MGARIVVILVLILWPALASGCAPGGDIDDPVIQVEADDPEMLAAEQRARDTVGDFIAALQDPAPEQTFFSVKVRFEDGDEVEYMWLIDLELVDGKFVGTVDNVPQSVGNVAVGDRRSVAPSEINDWLIVEGEEFVGGFTMEVLAKRQAEQE